ncbi:MAG: hypothetical protein LUG66_04220 [Clostridiales bacterium]|nr:hypothetical protein [Clostridiales bacterium]
MRKLFLTLVLAAAFTVNAFGAAELAVDNSTLSTTGVMDEDGGHTFTYYVEKTGSYGIINVGGDIYVDMFSSDGTFQENKKINITDEKFGGYAYDGTYHYFIFGNDNPSYSPSTTVYKLVKYNQSFNKVNSVTFRGSQIYAKEVFMGADGLCDMRVDDNFIFINDVVTEYKYENNFYQNNRSLVLNKNTLKTEADVGGISLNKLSKGRDSVLRNMSALDDGKFYFALELSSGINLFEVDPTDSESLGIHAITSLAKSALSAYYSDSIMTKASEMGETELKGFIAGENKFIAVGTEKSKDSDDDSTRIFVSTVSKSQMGVINPVTTAITDYGEIENVKVVEVSDTDIMVMWQTNGGISYCYLDGNGDVKGGTKRIYGAELGTSDPYITGDGKYMVWSYLVNDDDFAFYKYTF